jgi:hypothetical protein
LEPGIHAIMEAVRQPSPAGECGRRKYPEIHEKNHKIHLVLVRFEPVHWLESLDEVG